MSDADFFGAPELPLAVTPQAVTHRPDWFNAWLSEQAPDFVVYHDAWSALELFSTLQSQWRMSMDSITGLDYAAVCTVIALFNARKTTQREVFNDIQALEAGALTAFNELASQRSGKDSTA